MLELRKTGAAFQVGFAVCAYHEAYPCRLTLNEPM